MSTARCYSPPAWGCASVRSLGQGESGRTTTTTMETDHDHQTNHPLSHSPPTSKGVEGAGEGVAMRVLTDEQLDIVDRIINETEPEGDYVFDGEDSLWEESATETLRLAAQRVREYLRSLDADTPSQ